MVREGERVDDLGRKGYRLIQDPKAFCFGVDAVLLADFARPTALSRVLDLGTGTGVIPILMQARVEEASYFGLELQEEMAERADRSVRLNHLEDHIQIRQGDLKQVETYYPRASMDLVTCNPPYMKAPGGLKNADPSIRIARHEIACTLADVCGAAEKMLKFHGRFAMVHRPQRLVSILEELRAHHLEPKKLRFVHPYADKEPTMVLIEAVRGGREEMKVQPPLIIYREPGIYTEEIYRIYQDPAESEDREFL